MSCKRVRHWTLRQSCITSQTCLPPSRFSSTFWLMWLVCIMGSPKRKSWGRSKTSVCAFTHSVCTWPQTHTFRHQVRLSKMQYGIQHQNDSSLPPLPSFQSVLPSKGTHENHAKGPAFDMITSASSFVVHEISDKLLCVPFVAFSKRSWWS